MDVSPDEVGEWVAALKKLGRATRAALAETVRLEGASGQLAGRVEADGSTWQADVAALVDVARAEYPRQRIQVTVIALPERGEAERQTNGRAADIQC